AIPVTSRTRIGRIVDASLLRLTGRRVREPFIDVNCSEPQRRTAERAVQTPDARDANAVRKKVRASVRNAGCGGERGETAVAAGLSADQRRLAAGAGGHGEDESSN